MTRVRTSWLALALGAIALFAVACNGASASDNRTDQEGRVPSSEQGGGGSTGGEPVVIDPTGPKPADPDSPVSSNPGLPPDHPGDRPVDDGNGSSGGDPAPPAPVDPDLPRKPELAPIDHLELIVRESYPPQYAVQIQSGIPSGCAAYERTEVTRDGNTFTIEVWNSIIDDPDIACTMIYGIHEQTVNLADDLTPGQEYTVHVNNETITFVAQ